MSAKKPAKHVETAKPDRASKTKGTGAKKAASTEPRKTGRPTLRTDAMIDEICERLSVGEPLRSICRSDGMPSWQAIYGWMGKDDDLSDRIARARQLGYDAIAEQCLDIADDERHDWILTKKGPIIDEVAIGRAKLQIHTRLQLLSKWSPKKYGEKVETTLRGDADNPLSLLLHQISGASFKPRGGHDSADD